MFKKIKIHHPIASIVVICISIFMIGIATRFNPQDDLRALEKKNLGGFIILNISNIIKAGFWRINLNRTKPEMIAKNSMNVFKKGEKNPKRYLDPNISPDGNIIAYTLEFNGQKSISLMLSNGMKEVSFIELDQTDIEKPSFSPDGKTIAAISESKIYITSYPPTEELEIQSITSNPEVANEHLTWFDNKTLGYISHAGIFKIINIETANSKVITNAKSAAFSNNKKHLALTRNNSISVYNVNPEAENLKLSLYSKIEYDPIGQISWSPDNQHILVTIKQKTSFNQYNQIVIINISTKEILVLPKSWKESLSHSWSEFIE